MCIFFVRHKSIVATLDSLWFGYLKWSCPHLKHNYPGRTAEKVMSNFIVIIESAGSPNTLMIKITSQLLGTSNSAGKSAIFMETETQYGHVKNDAMHRCQTEVI